MFAVVVLLTKPQTHCVVPEKYIYGLEELEDELKTWGVNNQHKHLIFWTSSLLDEDVNTVATVAPDFRLVPENVFPPQTESACFYGRVKRFFKTFENAKEYCDKFRPILPVLYTNRISQQPTPENEPPQEEDVLEAKHVLQIELDELDILAFDNLFDDDDGDINAHDETVDPFALNGSELVHATATTNSDTSAEKQVDGRQHTDESDDSTNSTETGATETLPNNIKKNGTEARSNVVAPANHNLQIITGEEVTEKLADGMEMTYVLGQTLLPMADAQRVKANDMLSGNMPFQENDDQDRGYFVKVGKEFQEVKLVGRAVKWLLDLNVRRRIDSSVDKSFLKALLIAIFTVNTIKTNDVLQPELVSFAKDLFAIRVGDENGPRFGSFEKLLSVACAEIKEM